MKLYNSLSKKIEYIDDKIINIYNCGPTVYNDIHIGNSRPVIVFDVLYRYLVSQNIEVNYLHNLTDIDDKIIAAAKNKNQSELQLSSYFSKEYEDIRKKLNIKDMIIEKVSDNIDGIIDYIDRLVKTNGAYVVNGNVYFDTKKNSEYGKLSHRSIDDQNKVERIEENSEKKNPTDFVLWKNTNEGIKWETPWSLGRPGWHTECSYLIEKYFKTSLTIHGGGIDLKFPHHENENAQHECLYNEDIAKIWMHIGHINIDNQKMSKSLNNFILIKDILKEYSYQEIRWFIYKTNYRNPLNFNQNIMNETRIEIEKIQKIINTSKTDLIYNKSLSSQFILSENFIKEMDNDLNISNGITEIYDLIKKLKNEIRNKNYSEVNNFLNMIISNLSILGIEFENIHTDEVIIIINKYYSEYENKNFSLSDNLRKILIEKKIL